MPADNISSEIMLSRETAMEASSRSSRSGNIEEPWKILLDRREVGWLGPGETLTFPTSPGSHSIAVDVDTDWWIEENQPFTFDIGAGERIKLATRADSGGWAGIWRPTAPDDDHSSEIAITGTHSQSLLWVLLDDQNVGYLDPGGSLICWVSPGSHVAVVANEGGRTRSRPFPFNVSSGERIELAARSGRKPGISRSAVPSTRASTDVADTVEEGERYEVPLGDDTRVIDNSQSMSVTMRVFRLTREWTRTFTVDMARATTVQGSAGIGIRVLDLKASVERTLSKTYSVSNGERETFEEEVTFNVAPRTRCRAIFHWKEIHQKGVVQLTGGGSRVRIPYEVVVGITFDQQQIDEQA